MLSYGGREKEKQMPVCLKYVYMIIKEPSKGVLLKSLPLTNPCDCMKNNLNTDRKKTMIDVLVFRSEMSGPEFGICISTFGKC